MKTNFFNEKKLLQTPNIFLRFKIFIIVLLCFKIGYSQTGQTCLTGKHLPRIAPNLFDAVNGQFTEAEGDWLHYENLCYVGGQYPLWSSEPGYDGNPGCLKLTGPMSNVTSCGSQKGDMVYFSNFPIEEEKTYTISFRYKTEDFCYSPIVYLSVKSYSGGTFLQHNLSSRTSTSNANIWEEFSFIFKTPPQTNRLIISIRNTNYTQETEEELGLIAYVDNFYIGEGVSFEDPPSCKTPFDGENVQVDELGNIYTKNDIMNGSGFFHLLFTAITTTDL